MSSEFGVEPGAQLQRMHQRILRSDPDLRSPTATATPPPVRPRDDAVRPVEAPPAPIQPVPAHIPDLPPVTLPPMLRASVPVRLRLWLELIASLIVPLLSFGFLTWTVFAYHALRRRSWVQTATTAAYLLTLIGTLATSSISDERLSDQLFDIGMTVSMLAGAAHAVVLSLAYQVQYSAALEKTALFEWERAVRRRMGLELLRDNPDIARALNIGRPDLPPAFDDGGLVDINGAPPHILATLPGVRPDLAARIASDRVAHGPFATVDSLVERGVLPADVVRPLRDLLITGPVAVRAGRPR